MKNELNNIKTLCRLIPSGRRAAVPVLTEALILDGRMYATDFTIYMSFKTSIEGNGVLDINLIKKLPVLSASITDDSAIILTEKGILNKENAFKIDQFPNIPLLPSTLLGDFKQVNDLKKAVKFSSTDPLRPILSGVFMGEHIVGTDAHIMMYIKNESSIRDIVVPAKVVNLMIEPEYTVYSDDEFVCFKGQDQEIIYKLIDGLYPNYKAVLPKFYKAAIELDVKLLKRAVENSLPLAPYSKSASFLFQGESLVVITTNYDDNLKYAESMAISWNHADNRLKVGYNLEKVKKVLSAIEIEKLTLYVEESNRASLFGDNILLMPCMAEEDLGWETEFNDLILNPNS